MDVVEIAGENYEIYTQEEADNRGIDYVYWKDATEEGQYVITDDNYVCEVRKIYESKKGDRQIVLSGGRCWDNDSAEINYEAYKEVGNFQFNKPQTYMQREIKNFRSDFIIRFYARLRAQGVKHNDMPWDHMGRMYRPDTPAPVVTVKKLFRSKETMKEVSKQVAEIMDEKGLTEENLLDKYMDLLEMAKDEGDLTNLRLTLDSLSKKRGTDKPQQKQNLIEESVSMSREIGEGIKKEKQQIQATRTTRTDEDEEETAEQ